MAKLKKGSAAAKAWGRKMARLRGSPTKKSSSSKLKRRTMVKRKATRRRTTRSNKVLGLNVSKVGAAMLYGAMRSRTSAYLSQYTSKIPLGNISDEVGMFLVAAAGKKFLFKKAGIIRDALTIGQSIEAARVGEAVISGQVGLNIGGASTPSTNGNVF